MLIMLDVIVSQLITYQLVLQNEHKISTTWLWIVFLNHLIDSVMADFKSMF